MRYPNPNVPPEHAQRVWDTSRSSIRDEPVVTVRCTLVTPMFGGGVKPGEVDREMPIRASALRGHLRFWWRLLHGADRRPSDLFDVESDLWGRHFQQGASGQPGDVAGQTDDEPRAGEPSGQLRAIGCSGRCSTGPRKQTGSTRLCAGSRSGELKINMVAMRSNADQILPMLDYCFERGIELRFIELMNMGHLRNGNQLDREFL